MTYAHRQRREDQNRVMGRPLDTWKPWAQFPSYETMIRNARFLALEWGWEIELETGETLVKKEVRPMTLAKNPLTKGLNGRLTGSRDPHLPGRVLIPLTRQHSTLPKVTAVPPETFYRYNEKRQRVECLVTVMPDGLEVAWDTCGQCAFHIRACKCRAIKPGRSVVRLYELATGETFQKPVYTDDHKPSFVRSKPLTKEAPKLEKVSPVKKPVPLTKDTSLSDFDDTAKGMASDGVKKLLAGLNRPNRPNRPKLTKE